MAQPTLEEFRSAAAVCEIRWPFLRPLHTIERFEGFQRLGVELVLARDGRQILGVCFALPCRHTLGGDQIEWVSPFQLATRPETKNVGALIMMRIMSLYPTVASLGVTDEATPIYVALRWKRYGDIWRGVHPIDMRRLATDYGERLKEPWKRYSLPAAGGLYNLVAGPAEAILGASVQWRSWDPSAAGAAALREKGSVVATYFPMFESGVHTHVVDGHGIGRVLDPFSDGWGGLREHARVWRELRRRRAKLCEMLATTPEAKARLPRLGYVPIAMPMWYVERDGMGTKLIAALRRNQLSFFHTDKSI